MHTQGEESISVALERLALTLGESGAVPVAELVRALERAAERLRTRSSTSELPSDLVTQSEAARVVGVSRQAVNQWVRKGTLHAYATNSAKSRYAPEVSLAEVAIAANRRTREVPFSSTLRREVLDFLSLIERGSTRSLARDVRECIENDSLTEHAVEESRVLTEFVTASMGTGYDQHEFTEDGLKLLSGLDPLIHVDCDTAFGALAKSLGVLITSADGSAGFDAPVTALLGILGAATIGSQFRGDDAAEGRLIADAAREIWSDNWHLRLYDAVYHVGELRPSPLTRYTASLVYLDYHRFLRQAQSTGVTIAYSRGPGPIMPHRFYGKPRLTDILAGRRNPATPWEFSAESSINGRPDVLDSGLSPFRIMNYEYGLLDTSIHGIRRYCFSAQDAGDELCSYINALPTGERTRYFDLAISTLARSLAETKLELVTVDESSNFDWWKDHIIRSSPREIMLGLRDPEARKVAHALLVQTSMLPNVVEAADSDQALRDRLRIYVKNLEFDVIDARYQDDLRRGVSRIIKPGGESLDDAEAVAAAELNALMKKSGKSFA